MPGGQNLDSDEKAHHRPEVVCSAVDDAEVVKERRVTAWNQVTKHLLERYAAHLDDEGYAY